MAVHSPLPEGLGSEFSVAEAHRFGVTPSRLRGTDLDRPFHGVRSRRLDEHLRLNVYEQRRARERELIRLLSLRLLPGQFFSHRSAAILWGVPLPQRSQLAPHVSVLSPGRAPRVRGAIGHRLELNRSLPTECAGVPLTHPACTWAMLAADGMSVSDLVIAGDFLARVNRPGYGRPGAGTPPLASLAELQAVTDLGRWDGAARLREALPLIREDAWSPRETLTRLTLIRAGLPEPALNLDVFDTDGTFLACLDMAYEQFLVGVEYHGVQHADRYSQDVERLAGLRDAGWTMIEVTRSLAGRPWVVAARVERALTERGWERQS
ncbi:endonuclease domain-containing protein [Leucobacter sp. W1153]|uniref:endonuclease domain-containing protein n=1 Tax=Leucobacter sp. W1153 TaxID=3439064 RepID=UPI003F3C82ED